ncbi:hypothetical protein [Lysinibacillus sp. LZ02]|uniref:hypothetical protein n=1 Tax=Lysinibacillus sp. LZ02 TaxID=3420668 RepID=UPI003D35A7F2
MIEKYTIDDLTKDGVCIKKQTYIEYEGQQYPVGEIWRRAYLNTVSGRNQVIVELPEAQINAILAVWEDI